VENNGVCLITHMYHCSEAASGGRQGKAEKAMSTSKDSVTESAKGMSEDKPEGKGVGNAEDDEPLVSWILPWYFFQHFTVSNFLACFNFLN